MNRALSCVHPHAYFYVSKRPLATDWALVSEPASVPVTLGDGSTLYLGATQSFRMRRDKGQWRVTTEEYIYNVGELEQTRDYMLAWHWHPNQRPECHMHVKAEPSGPIKFDGKHLPTSRVSFEEVLRFLITECDVQPVEAEWHAMLEETQGLFEQFRSWMGSRKPGRG